MLGSVAAISAVSITIPNDPDILCLLGYKPTAMSVSASTWPHDVVVQENSRTSRYYAKDSIRFHLLRCHRHLNSPLCVASIAITGMMPVRAGKDFKRRLIGP